MSNNIVTVNVTVNAAPTSGNLQKQGALISQGATTLAAGASQFLSQLLDLTSILQGAKAITSLSWATNMVTVNTATPHGIPNGDVVSVTISGASPAGFNGTFQATSTGASTFTYPLNSDPGSETVPGSYTLADVAELTAMATTFFAQGSSQGVSVLELGETGVSDGVTALGAFIAANPNTFYSYLIPREWDGDSDFLTFLGNYETSNAKTYFFVTTTTETYTDYSASMKDVFLMVEAPGKPATEFSCAAPFYVTLNYNPSPVNKVTPTAFAFLFGVTAYPLAGNASLLASLKAANVNYVGTGAEGGLSNLILFWGKLQDGNDFTYWYSIDWVQINMDTNIANAVINGSNNPVNPLYYNQAGINTLEGVAAQTLIAGVAAGLVLGTVSQLELDPTTLMAQYNAGAFKGLAVVNAVPFQTYVNLNPNDFKAEKYAGLTAIYSPNRGFTNILFNIIVTDFVA